MTPAIYLDGRTPMQHRVDASITLDDAGRKFLHITGGGVNEIWPVRSVRRTTPQSVDEARFQLANSDPRLVVQMADAASLLAAAPELFRQRSRSGLVVLLATSVVIALGIIGAIFVIAPMVAGPIARATPLDVERAYGETTRRLIEAATTSCNVPVPALREAQALAEDLAKAANSPFETDLRFVNAGFPNAFAMPGGRIMVTGELIALLDSPDELAGVLAHETAHVAERHVMEALVREIGGAVILDLLIGGGAGAGQQIAMAGVQLQSLGHSRAAEKEADVLAIRYLRDLDIDPVALALFFDRLREVDGTNGAGARDRVSELLYTHPLTARRAEEARTLAAEAGRPAFPRPALSDEAWRALKDTCSGDKSSAPTGGPG